MNKKLSYLVGTVGTFSILGSVISPSSVSAVGPVTFKNTTAFIESLFGKEFKYEFELYDYIVNYFLYYKSNDFESFVEFFSFVRKVYNDNKGNKEKFLFLKLFDDSKKNTSVEEKVISDKQLEDLLSLFSFNNCCWSYFSGKEISDKVNAERAWNAFEVFLYGKLSNEKDVAQRYKKLQKFIELWKVILGVSEDWFGDLKGNLVLIKRIIDNENLNIGLRGDTLFFTNFFPCSKSTELIIEAKKNDKGVIENVIVDCGKSINNAERMRKDKSRFNISQRLFIFIIKNVIEILTKKGNNGLSEQICEMFGNSGKENETNSKSVEDKLCDKSILNKKTERNNESSGVSCSSFKKAKCNDGAKELFGKKNLDKHELSKESVFKSPWFKDNDRFMMQPFSTLFCDEYKTEPVRMFSSEFKDFSLNIGGKDENRIEIADDSEKDKKIKTLEDENKFLKAQVREKESQLNFLKGFFDVNNLIQFCFANSNSYNCPKFGINQSSVSSQVVDAYENMCIKSNGEIKPNVLRSVESQGIFTSNFGTSANNISANNLSCCSQYCNEFSNLNPSFSESADGIFRPITLNSFYVNNRYGNNNTNSELNHFSFLNLKK